jgi:uncharacterized phage infection (PIP) family protein YhgE
VDVCIYKVISIFGFIRSSVSSIMSTEVINMFLLTAVFTGFLIWLLLIAVCWFLSWIFERMER